MTRFVRSLVSGDRISTLRSVSRRRSPQVSRPFPLLRLKSYVVARGMRDLRLTKEKRLVILVL